MKHDVLHHLNTSEQLGNELLRTVQTSPQYSRLEPELLRLQNELRHAQQKLSELMMPYECYVVGRGPAEALFLETYRTLPLQQAQEYVYAQLNEEQRSDERVKGWQQALAQTEVQGFEYYRHQQLHKVTGIHISRFNGSYQETAAP